MQTEDIFNWMVESRTVLTKKDTRKGNDVANCRQIACLNLFLKLLTDITQTEPTTRGIERLSTKS